MALKITAAIGALIACLALSFFIYLSLQAVVFDTFDTPLQDLIDMGVIDGLVAAETLHYVFLAIMVGSSSTVVLLIGHRIDADTMGKRSWVAYSKTIVVCLIGCTIAWLFVWITSCIAVYATFPYISFNFIVVADSMFAIYVLHDPQLFYTVYFLVTSIFVVLTAMIGGIFDNAE